MKLLVKNRKQRVAALEKASGIEEHVSDLNALLDEIVMVQESSQALQADRKKERAVSADKAERLREDIRQKTLEGMKPRDKRKSTDDNALHSFLESRHVADTESKRQKLALEERRVALEERRLDLVEQKAALETKNALL